MPKIIYTAADGGQREVDVPAGLTVMQGAVRNGVAGIEADCGGACACATCHVYIDEAWRGLVGEPNSQELEMLDCATDPLPCSRLSCQIAVTAALDGLVVRLPVTQR